MPTVPSKQKIDMMQSGNGNMQGIFNRFGRDEALGNQIFGKTDHFVRYSEYSESFKCCQPPARGIGITRRTFLPD